MAAGSIKSKAMETDNVINPPLLTGDDSTLLRDIFFIPELHVMTGVVGKLMWELERSPAFASEKAGSDFTYKWMKSQDIYKSFHNGAPSFKGNMARRLLTRSNGLMQALQENLEEEKAALAFPFVHTLNLFNKVVESCFGQHLKGDYEGAIKEFIASYRSLGISVTLKVS